VKILNNGHSRGKEQCPRLGGVRDWEVSAIGRCPLLGVVRYWELSAIGRQGQVFAICRRDTLISISSSVNTVVSVPVVSDTAE